MVKMPDRIARLERDSRGYPIPWNVLRGDDGTAFFTINDDRRHYRAIREKLCPICGERLGRWKWFTGGPRSAFHPDGAYLDLPSHHECAQFALQTCPWLANPRYLGLLAEGTVPHMEKLPPEARLLLDQTVTPERPAVFVSVASDTYNIIGNNIALNIALAYVKPLRPYLAVEYWRHGSQLALDDALPLMRELMGEAWPGPPALREEFL